VKPIRVLFDDQIFMLQEYGGIGRYFSELAREFLEHPELGIQPVFESRTVVNRHLADSLGHAGIRSGLSRLRGLGKLVFGFLTHRRPSVKADLVHFTFYLPGYFGRYGRLPKLVTLYDMTPENTSSKRRFWDPHFSKKHYLSHADEVVSISSSSTKDMRREYGLTREITTTYLGVGKGFFPNQPALPSMPERYFLFVGARSGYKDFKIAAQAFSGYRASHDAAHLVLVGGGPISKDEASLASSLGISHRVVQQAVADADLPRVYANALALVYPSQYEGFGLPLVEAMASGIPILASDTPINREICGAAADYFPVSQFNELGRLMSNVCNDPKSYKDKIGTGLSRSAEFSWYRCAKKTAEVYREVMERTMVRAKHE
jgi:glycosyltransferase involved in cell wall biosynthesis